MRVAFLCHEYPPIGGGASTALRAFARGIARVGHTVQVVTIAEGDASELVDDEGVQVRRLAARRKSKLGATTVELVASTLVLSLHLRRELDDFQPDVVVAFFAFPAGFIAASFCRRRNIPLVVSLRGSDVPGFSKQRWGISRRILDRLARSAITRADRVFTNGENLRRLALLCVDRTMVDVIPNGVDVRVGTRACRGNPHTPRLLYVGQLIPRKRCRLMLQAVAASRIRPIHVTLVGDGPDRVELQQLSSEMPEGVEVEFTGVLAREQLAGYYSGHDLLLQVSESEGVSNVVLEALASGLPVLSCKEAFDGSIRDAGGYVLVDPVSPLDIAKELDRLFIDGGLKSLRVSVLENRNRLGWDTRVVELESMLRQLARSS